MEKPKRNSSITSKLVAAIVAAVIITSAIIGATSYTLHRNQSIEARGREALHIAVSTARRIDGDKFEEIMQTMEKNDYWYDIKAYADKLAKELGIAYLYIVRNHPEESESVEYFAEGTEDEPYDLGETDIVEEYADEMFATLENGQSSFSEAYASEEYGVVVSGFAAVFNSKNEVVGVVGVDFFLDDILAEVNVFGRWILMMSLIFIVLFYIAAAVIGKKFIGKPIADLDKAAKQIARGDMNVHIDIRTKSEIGRLSRSFREMVAAIQSQATALEAISRGDLTVDITPRGNEDVMGHAIERLVNSLNNMFGEIGGFAGQVSTGSTQISNGAQVLAQGATEQAAAIQELSASISEVAQVSADAADMAGQAAELTQKIRLNAEMGNSRMEQMLAAVKDINNASHNISKVIKVVDDIAFQTNILALNAAVEAARAGQHGKGFAVVADEVRSLAAKSAEAAKSTGKLISDSTEKAELGARIADETAASFVEIVNGISESNRIVKAIASSNNEQSTAISHINVGIDQVSQVVQQNSAAAQESAAASTEMSDKADALEELVSQFRLKENNTTLRLENKRNISGLN